METDFTAQIDMTPEPTMSTARGRRLGCYRHLEPMETAVARSAVIIVALKAELATATDPARIKKLQGELKTEEWWLRRMPLSYPDQPTRSMSEVDAEIDAIMAAQDAEKK